MKIWILSSNRWNSAITEYALSMARSLKEGGHDVLFMPLGGSPAHRRADQLGLAVAPLTTFQLKSGVVRELRHLAIKHAPSLLITCGGLEQTLSLFIPGVQKWRFRGERFRSFSPFRKLVHKLSHHQVAGFIVPCEVLANELKSFTEKTIHPIVIGLDASYWRPSPKTSKRPRCLIFGRFDPIKGHREFMVLWKQLLSEYIQCFPGEARPLLQIVGRNENLTKKDLLHAASTLGIRDDVEILEGHVHNPSELLSSTAIGIIPSLGSEVICRVAQEFLLCGTPILVSKAGALHEVLFDSAGLCSNLAPNDIPEIVSFLHTAFTEDPSLRTERSQKAKQRFSFEVMRSHLEKIL
ncbi:MAG: glycosyltransferase family 4 protein [Pseudomonadota bacterium]